jgi:hypothetical protein
MSKMGVYSQKYSKHNINDIWQCLQDAKTLADQISDKQKGNRVYQAFTSLAGDQTVGFLAYVIWKGRSSWLSSLRMD